MNITIVGLIDRIDPDRSFGTGARATRLRTVHIKEFEAPPSGGEPDTIPVDFWNKYADEFDDAGYRVGESVTVEARLMESGKGYAAIRARGISRGAPGDKPAPADEPPAENLPDDPMPF